MIAMCILVDLHTDRQQANEAGPTRCHKTLECRSDEMEKLTYIADYIELPCLNYVYTQAQHTPPSDYEESLPSD